MPAIRFLIQVSRPRFWLYVLGPYLVGLAAGASSRSDFASIAVAAFAVYFLFPANLLIYGVNDIFDFETDKLNPKKQDYELLVTPAERRGLVLAIAVLNVPFIIAAFFLNGVAIFAMTGFLLLSVFYSAWPIRAKAIPIVDSMFNALYVMPGVFGYGIMTGNLPPVLAMAAAFLWTMAMHAYSAIPDIASDRQAGVETVATFLGKYGTILFCSACYLGSAIFAFPLLGIFAGLFGLIYLTLMALSVFGRNSSGIFGIYRHFPTINSAVGFFLFWFVAYENLIRGS
ncbi:MAG: prenyltransferase [Acidobacteria bacterium]|nr:prenyltransferase [Acidobacteriota bacterium]